MKIKFIIFFLLISFNNRVVREANYTPLFSYFELTHENLEYYITFLDLEHPDIVIAQAILESGNLKSRKCKEDNNLFGMMHPRKRETYSKGEKWAKFDFWQQSVLDYKILQETMYKGLTRDEYLEKLNKYYCKEPGYKEKINKIANDYKNRQQSKR